MLKIKEAVIVEGRYDKIKLSNLIDALIIETNGFSVYKDKKKLDFIKRLANERGIIVITDSDHSGFQIRNYLSSAIPKEKIKHIYIPDIHGKEKRKKEASKEGKLGVEGIDDAILLSLFEKADIGKYDHECFRTAVRYGRFCKTPGDRRSYCAGWGRFVESGKKIYDDGIRYYGS